MKKTLLFTCYVFLLIFPNLQAQTSTPPPTGHERGMYVDCADDIIRDLLNSNTTKRDDLIAYASSRHITYMALYKLDVLNPTIVIRDADLQNTLSDFIDYCKQQISGLEIGMVVSSKIYTDAISYYNYGWPNSNWPCAYYNDPLPERINGILNPGEDASFDAKVVAEMARSMIDVKFYNDGIENEGIADGLPIVQQSFLLPHSGKIDWISLEYEYWHEAKLDPLLSNYSFGQSYQNYLDLLEVGQLACCATGYELELESELTLIDFKSRLVNEYEFTPSSGATLITMTGSTTLIGTNVPSTPSTSTSIGFDFKLNGVTYSDLSVSPDGWLMLGNGTATSESSNSVTSTSNTPKIYPYWDDLTTGTTGHVSKLLTGTAPDRSLVIEWNVSIPQNNGAANSTFQAILYEVSNSVEFRYGNMGSATMSSSVGMTKDASHFISVTISNDTYSTASANNSNTGQPASGKSYQFDLPCKPRDSNHPNATLLGFPDGQQQADEIDHRLNRILLVTYTRFTDDLFHRQCHNYNFFGNSSTNNDDTRIWPLFSVEFPNIGQQRCSGSSTGCGEAFLGLYLASSLINANNPCGLTNSTYGQDGEFEDIESWWIDQYGEHVAQSPVAIPCDHCNEDYAASGLYPTNISDNLYDGFMWFTYSLMDQMDYFRLRSDKTKQLYSLSDFELYPNPTTGEILIKSKGKNIDSIEVMDGIGNINSKFDLPKCSLETRITIIGKNGLYLVKVMFEDNSFQCIKVHAIQ